MTTNIEMGDYRFMDIEMVILNGRKRKAFKAYRRAEIGGDFVYIGWFKAPPNTRMGDLWSYIKDGWKIDEEQTND